MLEFLQKVTPRLVRSKYRRNRRFLISLELILVYFGGTFFSCGVSFSERAKRKKQIFICNLFLFRFELALQQNEIMDVFYDDYVSLADEDSTFGSKSDNYLKVDPVDIHNVVF